MPSRQRLSADLAFFRTAGAPLVAGNAVRLLKDAAQNYPAWLAAIAAATHWIHFECYIVSDDRTGQQFADALSERARAGVRVRLLYDWLGGLGSASRRFWRPLRAAGVDVRVFNPPRLDSPFGWMSRDHRKMLAVDGRVAFVSGLCVGDQWTGDVAKGVEPWRDTGMSIVGPAVADVEEAFHKSWAAAGPPVPTDEHLDRAHIVPAGDISLRVVDSEPATGGMFRLDQLVASVARKTLWVTDAYFVGVSTYIHALETAAQDGVDVRLLVPGSGSDIAAVQQLTRAGYRSLLEGGVRVFEWNGSMMHAKTAVADGRWARVGSTNLNIQSWLGNWELDVAVEDEGFGQQMQAMYEEDLQNATEIVLESHRVQPTARRPKRRKSEGKARGGSTSRAAAGALRIGNTFGAALTSKRAVGASEALTLIYGAGVLFGVAVVAILWPAVVAVPLGILLAWLGMSWLMQAWKVHRRGEPAKP